VLQQMGPLTHVSRVSLRVDTMIRMGIVVVVLHAFLLAVVG
jgi:hypothetical protein